MNPSDKSFIDAAAAAYAWLCFSDGEITRTEVNYFIDYLNNSPFTNQVTEQDFKESFVWLLEAFEKDFEDGKARSIVRIEPFRAEPNKAIELVRIARKAMVADMEITDAEELALNEISSLLDVDEAHLID